jgi:hypothetical protein
VFGIAALTAGALDILAVNVDPILGMVAKVRQTDGP